MTRRENSSVPRVRVRDGTREHRPDTFAKSCWKGSPDRQNGPSRSVRSRDDNYSFVRSFFFFCCYRRRCTDACTIKIIIYIYTAAGRKNTKTFGFLPRPRPSSPECFVKTARRVPSGRVVPSLASENHKTIKTNRQTNDDELYRKSVYKTWRPVWRDTRRDVFEKVPGIVFFVDGTVLYDI